MPPNERIAQCLYLESHTERKDGTLYYYKTKKMALISAYCMAGICPADDFRDVVRHKKTEKCCLLATKCIYHSQSTCGINYSNVDVNADDIDYY